MKTCRASLLPALGFAMLLPREAPAQPDSYHVVDVGVVEGFADGVADGINDAGTVVGTLSASTGISQAFLYTEGGGIVLLDFLVGGTASGASAINGAGVVVGVSNAAAGIVPPTGVLWSGPSAEPAPFVNAAGLDGSTTVTAINAAGDAVGASSSTSSFPPSSHAILWPALGGATDLSTIIGSAGGAQDINDSGQVIVTFGGLLAGHASLWSEASGSEELIGLPEATRTSASAINAAGVVVGSSGPLLEHATRWLTPTQPEDLGVLLDGGNSVANDINDAGTVVGTADTASGLHAVVWTAAGGMQDLNALSDADAIGMTLWSAEAINASGQIVGTGYVEQGQHQHGFLATPASAPAAAWPAIAALAWLRHRRA
jgi:probable HAF family extracellular repeat protein